MIRLAAALLLVACAVSPPVVRPDVQADAWHTSRVVEALVNGCERPCPDADRNCIDDYGLCYTPCAWGILDAAERKALQQSALETDPTRTFLIDCRRPVGAIEASR